MCPLSSCCFMSPKFFFLGIGFLGLAMGLLSAVRPKGSIGLYQWIMERFNWKVVPIDELREVRNTRILGVALTVLSLAIFFATFSHF
ncbi:MAG: hypothetical protein WCJ71_00360 [Candidatus Omnitrophota bacterium]